MKRYFEDYKEIKSYSPNTAISHTFRFFSPRKTLFACFVGVLPTPGIYGLLKDLGCKQATASALQVDNQSCIAIATNSTSLTRTKHIDIRYHKLRELVANKTLNISFVSTMDQLANPMTKSLAKDQFSAFVPHIGLSTLR